MKTLFFLLLTLPVLAQQTGFELTGGGLAKGLVLERYADGSVRLQLSEGSELTIPAGTIVRERRRLGKMESLSGKRTSRMSRSTGVYTVFEPGVNMRYDYFSPLDRVRRDLYQRQLQLNAGIGKQLGTEWAIGIGSGLYAPDRLLWPVYAEAYYIPTERAVAPLFYAAAGWTLVPSGIGPGPYLTDPETLRGFDSSYRSGLFLRSKIGLRIATKRGLDLLPNLGLAYAQNPLSYIGPGGEQRVNSDHLFFAFGFGLKW